MDTADVVIIGMLLSQCWELQIVITPSSMNDGDLWMFPGHPRMGRYTAACRLLGFWLGAPYRQKLSYSERHQRAMEGGQINPTNLPL